ncbi:MAG: ABC-ATPase domain-containing protein [Thermodesulfobacteriota bacterium]|nr:ABC-ATPase domain-containing protein [Thermodesulfobacteriota bacterium]
MRTKEDLERILQRIDRKGYKAYRDIEGEYDFVGFVLLIDHVQGDPFASPSRVRGVVSRSVARFPDHLLDNKIKRIALGDYLTRQFAQAIKGCVKGNRGIGNSGSIGIDIPGQEVMERTSVLINHDSVEVRFVMGLPASGRTVLSREAYEMFFHEVPKIVKRSLKYPNLNASEVKEHIETIEDQEFIRERLGEYGLISFVANGSILPRASGVDDRPLSTTQQPCGPVIPFKSPSSLEVEFAVPNKGRIQGMGIRKGVTLIVGGGFHGKSTLLNAVERAVYCHIPRDGREYVVTNPASVKIRAEDGRRIEKVDISPFIKNLPFGKETSTFSTDNASGSTSQAANIIEALEIGVQALLIDEDTSATNFMIRDLRMQKLVSKDKEPITPFIDRVRQIYTEMGVSTILVMGGSGDYFDVADTVLMMNEYCPKDVTARTREITRRFKNEREAEGGSSFEKGLARVLLKESFNPQRGKRDVKIDAKGLKMILYGKTSIDLLYLEQLLDISQTRAIGRMIHYYSQRYLKDGDPLRVGLNKVMDDLDKKGLDILYGQKIGNFARPRIFELAAAMNRMRTLRVR